jgi:hypothetical protein
MTEREIAAGGSASGAENLPPAARADGPLTDSLWHYTCRHRAARIGQRGTLTPNPQSALGGIPMVWLTDMDTPDTVGLGLTSTILKCDRTEVRYRVIDGLAIPWCEWADLNHIDRTARSELTFGRRHRHWFVSTGPVTVERADA